MSASFHFQLYGEHKVFEIFTLLGCYTAQNLCFITSQKSEDVIYTVAEARNHA